MVRYFVVLALVAVGFLAWINQPAAESASQQLTNVKFVLDDEESEEAKAKIEYADLQKQFNSAMAELKLEIAKADSKQAQAEILFTKNPSSKFAERHMAHAQKYVGTKASLNSVLFAVGVTNGDQKNEAMKFLIENYANKVRLDKIAGSFKQEVPSQDIEDWYKLMIEKAEKDSVKVSVMYDYAKYVSQFGTFQKTLDVNPQVAERLPKEQLEYIMAERSKAQIDAMAKNLQTIIDEYGDLKKGRTTYASLAKKELFDLLHLQVGQVAPEIEGNDLDGVAFRLSDYRGKVVMLDFWGHWCPPCRAMYPQERELVKALADKPFVLIGVNSDRNKEVVKQAVRNEGLGWRHFWNGPKGQRGPISEQWNVEGWPTVYLIDAEGVIRYKGVQGEAVEKGIEKLMAELEYEVSL